MVIQLYWIDHGYTLPFTLGRKEGRKYLFCKVFRYNMMVFFNIKVSAWDIITKSVMWSLS